MFRVEEIRASELGFPRARRLLTVVAVAVVVIWGSWSFINYHKYTCAGESLDSANEMRGRGKYWVLRALAMFLKSENAVRHMPDPAGPSVPGFRRN